MSGSVLQLAEDKYTNFKAYFRPELLVMQGVIAEHSESNSPPDLLRTTFERDVLPPLITALTTGMTIGMRLPDIVKDRDDTLLLGFVELENPEVAKALRVCIMGMRNERRDKMWRYLAFFLDAVTEMIKGE